MTWILTWILTTISLVGNFLNCKKMRSGFMLWLVCNTGWLAYDLYNGIYARANLDIVQSAFCIYGLIEWKKERTVEK